MELQAPGKKPMWCTPAEGDVTVQSPVLKAEPEAEAEAEADGRLGASSTLLALHAPSEPGVAHAARSEQPEATATPFAMRHNVASLLSTSPGSTGSSDTGSSGTDRSTGTGFALGGATRGQSCSESTTDRAVVRRLSSVTLMELDDDTNAVGGKSGSDDGEADDGDNQTRDAHRTFRTPPPAALDATTCQEDVDDELRYIREVERPIPLNTLTQEKVHPPRKRPAPSPRSARLYPNGTQYSWKRRSQHPVSVGAEIAAAAAVVRSEAAKTEVKSEGTPSGRTGASLSKLASKLWRQFEDEAVGTLLVYQPTCLDHHNDSHQESRQRLGVLGGREGVLLKDRFKDLKWANLNELRPARLNDILRVHTYEYIQHLERACGNLPEQKSELLVGPLYDKKGDEKARVKHLTHSEWLKTEKAQKCFEAEDQPSGGSFDMDSPISKSSYLAARMAAGAVCHAVDMVLTSETKNAFVVVRPPGHHAGPNGCVEGEGFHLRPEMCTCGFCLLNNVCIGASYAMSNYSAPYYSTGTTESSSASAALETNKRVTVKRVAIVDFDIHHGNGTEEVIRNLVPHKQNYPLPPSWAPVQFSSYKPWRDEKDSENVFFSSIHLYDDDNFYPCSGVGPHGCSPELQDNKNIVNLPLDVLGPKFLDERLKLSSKAKKALMEQSSKTFRQNVTEKLIPALTKFNPDLIMLSAGFDGHADDFYYFLSEDDYGWITEQVATVAEECCDGRMVSCLEGGYNVVPSKFQRPRPRARKNTTSNFHHAAKLHNREVDEELNTYGSLARSVSSHVTALLRASQS